MILEIYLSNVNNRFAIWRLIIPFHLEHSQQRRNVMVLLEIHQIEQWANTVLRFTDVLRMF